MRSPAPLFVVVALTLAGCPAPEATMNRPPDFSRPADMTTVQRPDLRGMDLAGVDLTPPTVEDLAPADDLSVAMDMTGFTDLTPASDLTPVADLAPEADLSIPVDMTPEADLSPVVDMTPEADLTPALDMTPPPPTCGAGQPMLCANGQPCAGPADCQSGICSPGNLCVECVTAATCPGGPDNDCHTRTCNNNVCGIDNAPPSQEVSQPNQIPGDCNKLFCNGSGGTRPVIDDTDLPTVANDCKTPTCTVGVAGEANKVGGATCSSGGGLICDGKGACVNQNVWVSVSTDTTASTAVATTIQVRGLDGTLANTLFTNPIALPSTAGGANPVTLSGNASLEGGLTRSSDGKYVVLAGYAAAAGVNVKVAASSVGRVVARIGANGSVDSTTTMNNAFSGGSASVRGAASDDGSAFWVSGDGNSGTNGIQYVAYGGTAATQVVSTPSNMRRVAVVGSRLYGTSGSASYTSIATYSAALPTATATTTVLNGLPTTGASPVGFVLLDRDPNVAGVDTAYIADDNAAAASSLTKWTFNGTTWTQATFAPTGYTTGMRNVTGFVSNGSAILVAADKATSATKLFLIVDDGSTTTPAAKLLSTASANTAYRGLALAPLP